MGKKKHIPVHRMEQRFSGVYVAPLAAQKSSPPAYEMSQPHRHDYYYCVLLDKGNMALEIDFQNVQLTDQSLFLSYPGQIHQINSARLERGWFLAFEPSMLTEELRDILDQCLSEVILFPLSPEQSTDFFSFTAHLWTVYADQSQRFRQPILQSMVTALVYQLASVYLSIERFNLIRYSARSIEIIKTFKQLLRRHVKTTKRPAEFADKMNMTVSYLNDTVRSVTGFPITYHIQQELMREARRLLYHSDLTVAEVADSLGFEDARYFNRLFHKVIGVSPGVFRKEMDTTVRLSPGV